MLNQNLTLMQASTGRFKWLLAGLLVVSTWLLAGPANAQVNYQLVAPTILSPSTGAIVTDTQTLFTGVTFNQTQVDIYIDGIFNGKARVKNHPSGVASWSYRARLPLALNKHTVYAVARSQDQSLRSTESRPVVFNLEAPLPAPTLFDPQVTDNQQYRKPMFRGVTKNNTEVNLYVDGQLAVTLKPVNHPSGATSFDWQPAFTFDPGWHSIQADARDSRGKISRPTAALVFEIREETATETTYSTIAPTADQTTPSVISAPTLLTPGTGSVTSENKPLISGLAHSNQSVEIFIDNILNGEVGPGQSQTGVFGFTYLPFLRLEPGLHTVRARASNQAGAKSGWSNQLSFIVKPTNRHIVVSPAGVRQLVLTTNRGQVAATSTEQTVDGPAKPDQETNPLESPTSSTGSEATTTRPVDDNLVVIGAQDNDAAADNQDRGNTALVVALAIAAIVIIGLISWYTSRETEPLTKEIDSANKLSNKPEPLSPNPPSWEEEPISTEPETSKQVSTPNDNDIPPPPPPPALGI